MRIVILLPALHAGAELALNKILKSNAFTIVGVVRSDISFFKKKYWKYVTYGIRRSGIFYGIMIALMAYLHIFGVVIASILWWRRKRKWQTIQELSKKIGFEIFNTQNINNTESQKWIESKNPDVIVSLYFDQILKKNILSIPQKAVLNMHPGLLPCYRGLWPEFWNLLHREKMAGVTIHHINEKIDAGDIIAQLKYPIRKWDTRFSLMLKSADRGTRLLIKILSRLKKGKPLKPLQLKGKIGYHSLPDKAAFDRFFSRGKQLFSWAGFWREFQKRF